MFAVGQTCLAVLHGEGWKRAESYLHFMLVIPVAWAVPRLYMWQLGMDLITQRPLLDWRNRINTANESFAQRAYRYRC